MTEQGTKPLPTFEMIVGPLPLDEWLRTQDASVADAWRAWKQAETDAHVAYATARMCTVEDRRLNQRARDAQQWMQQLYPLRDAVMRLYLLYDAGCPRSYLVTYPPS